MSARIAFVTGGAQGIGEAIAIRLAEDGLDVAVLDIKGKEEQLQAVAKKVEQLGRRSCWVLGDVTVEQDVKNAVNHVVQILGGLDVMVANAGITLFKPFLETSIEEWGKQLAVNATGTMLCFKIAAEQMIKQGRGGRIIGASSGAGKKGTFCMSAYSASKFAVRGLTQAVGEHPASCT
ncbi:hypothetical protein PHLCEN_2v9910 [Hermanssonia centrifuga]|uniref:Uncharacterized protein n=1 Tax=Hermanssonia centrifuga TaxID=98765 RepID=A0A2R6NPN2_9APHY|nr:hypothetical protein PHLCEN_2v9910 [Hermanssonia centrifuga]